MRTEDESTHFLKSFKTRSFEMVRLPFRRLCWNSNNYEMQLQREA